MNQQFKIYAIQRSGHTAILNWLCENNHPAVLMNHNRNNLTNAGHLRMNWECPGRIFTYTKKNGTQELLPFGTSSRAFNNVKKNLSKKRVVFWVYENEKPETPTDIIIIRSPLNCLASRYKLMNLTRKRKHNIIKKDEELKTIQDLYINHLNSKNYKIIFDKWFTDNEYRIQICKDLGLNYGKKGLQSVISTSSFDVDTYKNKAQQMDVLNRWQQYKNDKKFMDLYTSEIQEAWEKYDRNNNTNL